MLIDEDTFYTDIDSYVVRSELARSFDYENTKKEMICALKHFTSIYGTDGLFDNYFVSQNFTGSSQAEKMVKVALNCSAISEFRKNTSYWQAYEHLRSCTPWSNEKIECCLEAFAKVLCLDIDPYLTKSRDFVHISACDYSFLNISFSVSDFFISKKCVSKKDWKLYIGKKSYFSDGSDDTPVCDVSWMGAVEYCNYKSLEDGLERYYVIAGADEVSCCQGADGYRLPTVSEWLYVAGGGKLQMSSTFYEKKKSSPFGLYSMNDSAEWCFDVYDPNPVKKTRAVCGDRVGYLNTEDTSLTSTSFPSRWKSLEIEDDESLSYKFNSGISHLVSVKKICTGLNPLEKSPYITFRLVRNRI